MRKRKEKELNTCVCELKHYGGGYIDIKPVKYITCLSSWKINKKNNKIVTITQNPQINVNSLTDRHSYTLHS